MSKASVSARTAFVLTIMVFVWILWPQHAVQKLVAPAGSCLVELTLVPQHASTPSAFVRRATVIVLSTIAVRRQARAARIREGAV